MLRKINYLISDFKKKMFTFVKIIFDYEVLFSKKIRLKTLSYIDNDDSVFYSFLLRKNQQYNKNELSTQTMARLYRSYNS